MRGVHWDGSWPMPYSSRHPVKPPFVTSIMPVMGSEVSVTTVPSFRLVNCKTGCGSEALHSRSGAKNGLRGRPCESSQSRPAPDLNQLRPHLSLTFMTKSFLTKSLHASPAIKPVHVSMLIWRNKSCEGGRGGWSAAKNSVRWPPLHHCEGSVPEIEQMTFSVMPPGIANAVGAPPLTTGTAYCMNADQMGAAPERPVVLTMGV